jgi:hypothetical protein
MSSQSREAVAYFFEGDEDVDGLPDGWEWYYLATAEHDGAVDLNSDGFGLLQEYQAGRAPTFGYSSQPGGVAYADSALVTVNRVGYPSYTLRSVPAGTISETDVVPPDTGVTTPNLTQGSFGYWAVDGVAQRDVWGVGLRQVSFTMGDENREAVAYIFEGDWDADGLPDAWEWYYLGTTEHGGSVDLNGDGFTLLQDYEVGRAPTFGYSSQSGGVAWADSAMITFDRAGVPIVLRASAKVGVATSISVSKLATRASSVFGTAATVASVDASSEDGGTVVLAGSVIHYTPAVGFAGVDRFRVTFNSSGGELVGLVEMTTTGAGSEPSPSSSLGVNPGRLTPLSNGRIGIQFNGIPGVGYQLQRSTDLVSWTTVATITAGSRGEISYTDENPPSPNGFYRLSTP